jgi:hypothetical protein
VSPGRLTMIWIWLMQTFSLSEGSIYNLSGENHSPITDKKINLEDGNVQLRLLTRCDMVQQGG